MAEEIDKITRPDLGHGQPAQIQDSMVRISELENEGDSLFFTVIAELFRKAAWTSIEILKWKEVYEGLEEACDRCKDFTHVVGNVRSRTPEPGDADRRAASSSHHPRRADFDFLNGFHDAANSIATVVSTRVLSPQQAVCGRRFSTSSPLSSSGRTSPRRSARA